VAAERNGPVRAVPIADDSIDQIQPVTGRWIDPDSNLMTDGHLAFRKIGQQHASHLTILHGQKEYVRGSVHINTVESFGALLERAKQGVFHYLSQNHLQRYLHELAFRWEHRVPAQTVKKKGKTKIILKPKPTIELFQALLNFASGRQIRRTLNNSVFTFGCI
jgi:hypothetical protein